MKLGRNSIAGLSAALLSLTAPVAAQQEYQGAEAPPPPPATDEVTEIVVPPPIGESESIEPEVTIIRRERETVEEFRINGELYMIKVTPKKGVPYYMMDSDGDGRLDTRQNELDPRLLVPSWVIFRW